MQASSISLRPAWRNQWALILFGSVFGGIGLLAMAVGVEGSDGESQGGGEIYVLLASVVAAIIIYRRYVWLFTIDAERVRAHHGIIARTQRSLRLRDLRAVELDQSLFQRIFGVGDLAFYSAGSADAEIRFYGVLGPGNWRDRVDQMVDAREGVSA